MPVKSVSGFVNRSRRWKGREISHGEFLVAAIHVSAAAHGTSLERVWHSGGDCSEGSNGKKAEEAREHVWQ